MYKSQQSNSKNKQRFYKLICLYAYMLVPLTTVSCTYVLLMTLDLVGCSQALGSPICLVDVADSLSTQQVLSGLTFGH